MVEAIGPGVSEVAVGDRVVYASLQGAYAEVRLAPAARLVKLPSGIDDKTAAAMMLKGLTAEYLLLRCARVARGDTDPFSRRRRGVGSIACQWAKAPRPARDRHGGRPDEGGAGGGARLRPRHRLRQGRRRRAREGADRRRRGERGVRRRRQADVRCVARLPGDARDAGAVRPGVRDGAALRSGSCWPGHRCSSTRPRSATTSRRATSWSRRRRALFEVVRQRAR